MIRFEEPKDTSTRSAEQPAGIIVLDRLPPQLPPRLRAFMWSAPAREAPSEPEPQ